MNSEITHEMGMQNAGQINYSAQEEPNIVESVLQNSVPFASDACGVLL